MQLVNSLGEIVEFDTSESKYTGGTSEIYEVDESTLLKVPCLNSRGISTSPFSKESFDLLKTINHENFISLSERYNRVPQTTENVEAYTYEHIKGETYNLLFLRTDFMIDQFYNICQLYNIFSNEGIAVFDAHAANSVVLKERIVIIDPDIYSFFDNKEIVLERNSFEFIRLIKSYFADDLCDKQKRWELFDGMMEEKDLVLALEKRLKGYKRPYDYFLDK